MTEREQLLKMWEAYFPPTGDCDHERLGPISDLCIDLGWDRLAEELNSYKIVKEDSGCIIYHKDGWSHQLIKGSKNLKETQRLMAKTLDYITSLYYPTTRGKEKGNGWWAII